MARCPACGNTKPRGKLTCRRCGNTLWPAIAFQFIAVTVVKILAICGGLWLQNPWLKNLTAWGGSMLAAFLLLGAVGSVTDALRTRKPKDPVPPEREVDRIVRAKVSLGESIFVLALVLGFVLVGNTIQTELGVCLAFTLGLFAVALVFGMLRASLLSAASRKLAARMVAQPELWPAVQPPPYGVVAADPAMSTSQEPPAGAAPMRASRGSTVQLRVRCPGAWVVASLTATVALDGELIAIGSLRSGFDARAETVTGVHELQVRWARITEKFALYLPLAGAYEAELRYSGFWAKFLPRGAPE